MNSPSSGSSSVRWNAIGLFGRQVLVLAFSLVLARLLGPGSYGVIAQAQIFITFTTLLLDQGLSASLIQVRALPPLLPGAISTLNLALASFLALITVALAWPTAAFFRTPEVRLVLVALGVGLLFKGLAIVPRALLLRNLDFIAVSKSDITSALIGGAAGIVAAALGADYWALVVQVLVTDASSALIMTLHAGFSRPNTNMTALRASMGFSGRIFGGNILAFASRNSDNILIGRFLGATQLGYYGLAYRVLLTPVQMLGQTVVRVIFPHISRLEDNIDRTRIAVIRSLRGLAATSFPLMATIGISARDSVPVVLGGEWTATVPILVILAFTGARQTVTSIAAPIFMAIGRADVHLKFSLFAAVLQVSGICAGLPFGILGVAIGYTIAGIVATPISMSLVGRFTHVTIREQLLSAFPPLHGAVWMMLAYEASRHVGASHMSHLVIGLPIAAGAYCAVLRFGHRRYSGALLRDLRDILGLAP